MSAQIKTVLEVAGLSGYKSAFAEAGAAVISVDFNNTTDAGWILSGPETAGPLGSP